MSLRAVMQDLWIALGGSSTSNADRLRVVDTPVTSAAGTLLAALDDSGCRHLLVPVSADRVVRGGLNGPALVLRKRALEDGGDRQTFADLSCLRRDLDDVFTGLCADVLRNVEEDPRDSLKVLYGRLDSWRALFRTSSQLLGPDQQAGLFAELTVLVDLLRRDPSAHRTWTGPTRYRHDFLGGSRAIEVKATTVSDGRRIRIHGLDQLEAPTDGLHLYWIRLEKGSRSARSLNSIVDEALKLCDDEADLRTRLAAAGYQVVDHRHYDEPRFAVAEQRRYLVGPDFPRLVAGELQEAGISVNVTDVQYTVDLSSEPPLPLSDEQADEHAAAMLKDGEKW
ncbi:PD-(D/E)XK motif protein [Kribbella sp. NPDC005582]|uniref:PD-(D/E)XK motif protein n=1 Tax=Kribbella sp. NPDC005582 TaxID=3156893 RepID=UPI0033AD15B8